MAVEPETEEDKQERVKGERYDLLSVELNSFGVWPRLRGGGVGCENGRS